MDQGQVTRRSPRPTSRSTTLLRERLARRSRPTAGCRRKARTIRARLAGATRSGSSIRSTARAPIIAGREDWSISVALVEDGRPRAGRAVRAGDRRAVPRGRGRAARPATACRSRSGPATGLDGARSPVPSSSSERIAELHPAIVACRALARWRCGWRASRTASSTSPFAGGNSHDWDLAAADLLVHEAGGALTDSTASVLIYNRPEPVHGAAGCRRPCAPCTALCDSCENAERSSSDACAVCDRGEGDVGNFDGRRPPRKQLLHLVFGGELSDLDSNEFKDLAKSRSSASIRTTRPPMRPGRPRRSRPSTTRRCATSSFTCTACSIRRPDTRGKA